jgi:hypothetical protein
MGTRNGCRYFLGKNYKKLTTRPAAEPTVKALVDIGSQQDGYFTTDQSATWRSCAQHAHVSRGRRHGSPHYRGIYGFSA